MALCFSNPLCDLVFARWSWVDFFTSSPLKKSATFGADLCVLIRAKQERLWILRSVPSEPKRTRRMSLTWPVQLVWQGRSSSSLQRWSTSSETSSFFSRLLVLMSGLSSLQNQLQFVQLVQAHTSERGELRKRRKNLYQWTLPNWGMGAKCWSPPPWPVKVIRWNQR